MLDTGDADSNGTSLETAAFHPLHSLPPLRTVQPSLESFIYGIRVWCLAPPRDRHSLTGDGMLPTVPSAPGTQQTFNKCWSVTWDRILENNSAGTSSGNRLDPKAKDTQTRGAQHSASDPRRPGEPNPARERPRAGPTREPPGRARAGLPPKTHATGGGERPRTASGAVAGFSARGPSTGRSA